MFFSILLGALSGNKCGCHQGRPRVVGRSFLILDGWTKTLDTTSCAGAENVYFSKLNYETTGILLCVPNPEDWTMEYTVVGVANLFNVRRVSENPYILPLEMLNIPIKSTQSKYKVQFKFTHNSTHDVVIREILLHIS
jgi:hypothetical protein